MAALDLELVMGLVLEHDLAVRCLAVAPIDGCGEALGTQLSSGRREVGYVRREGLIELLVERCAGGAQAGRCQQPPRFERLGHRRVSEPPNAARGGNNASSHEQRKSIFVQNVLTVRFQDVGEEKELTPLQALAASRATPRLRGEITR